MEDQIRMMLQEIVNDEIERQIEYQHKNQTDINLSICDNIIKLTESNENNNYDIHNLNKSINNVELNNKKIEENIYNATNNFEKKMNELIAIQKTYETKIKELENEIEKIKNKKPESCKCCESNDEIHSESFCCGFGLDSDKIKMFISQITNHISTSISEIEPLITPIITPIVEQIIGQRTNSTNSTNFANDKNTLDQCEKMNDYKKVEKKSSNKKNFKPKNNKFSNNIYSNIISVESDSSDECDTDNLNVKDKNFIKRQTRARTQFISINKFYLTNDNIICEVTGTTGNLYLLELVECTKCTCEDYIKHQHVCKHIIYVIGEKLKSDKFYGNTYQELCVSVSKYCKLNNIELIDMSNKKID